jgi:hypothetical protein
VWGGGGCVMWLSRGSVLVYVEWVGRGGGSGLSFCQVMAAVPGTNQFNN